MRIREGFSWSFNGIEKSHEFRRKDFHGVAVHGSFRRPLNSCPMKKHGYAINIERLRRDFFELRALRGQKDHNNLLPPVKSRGITCVSRRGMTLMAAFIIVTHEKCCSVAHF